MGMSGHLGSPNGDGSETMNNIGTYSSVSDYIFVVENYVPRAIEICQCLLDYFLNSFQLTEKTRAVDYRLVLWKGTSLQ